MSPILSFIRENENKEDEDEDLEDNIKDEGEGIEEAIDRSVEKKCYVYGQCQVWSPCQCML